MGRRLVNGVDGAGIAADDRGLHYGDGLFETMAAVRGRVRNFELHMGRLAEGARRLGFPPIDADALENECRDALGEQGSGVVKLVLTRGPGPRGYRPPDEPSITRVITASAARPTLALPEALTVRICDTRLGLNPALAGIKHLNRLEQVLACNEWRDPAVGEGLMLAADGRLICGTASNLFVVREGRLLTPTIRDCGVAGVMRQVVMRAAQALGIECLEREMGLEMLATAGELFLTNAVAGIRPVRVLVGHGEWPLGSITSRLIERLAATGEG
jgi:4-amino-4-deoxychorismate lyase